MLSGADRIKLAKELSGLRSGISGSLSGAEKIQAARRISEIRKLLIGVVADSIDADSVDVSSPESISKFVYAYVKSIGNDYDALHQHTASVISSKTGASLSDLDGTKINMEEAKLKRLKSYESEGAKLMPENFGGLLLSEDEVRERTERRSEIFKELSGAIYKDGDLQNEYVAYAESVGDKLNSIRAETDEFKKGAPEGYYAYRNWYNENKKEITRLKTAYTKERNKVDALCAEWLENRQKQTNSEKLDEVDRINMELEAAGKSVIDSVMAQSNITREEADDWARNKAIVDDAVFKQLKRNGYQGDLLEDMSEFYRITGGKLSHVHVKVGNTRRAFARNAGDGNISTVHTDSDFTKGTLWHELGHHIEFVDDDAKAAAHAFLVERRDDEKLYSLRKLAHKGYDANEMAWKDDFHDPYVGKHYKSGSTEVFSMGIECLANPSSAAMLASKDPQLLNLVMGYVSKPLSPLSKLRDRISEGGKQDKISEAEQREVLIKEIEKLTGKIPLGGVEKADPAMLEAAKSSVRYDSGEIIGTMPLLDNVFIYSGKIRKGLTRRFVNGYYLLSVTHRDDIYGDSRFYVDRYNLLKKDLLLAIGLVIYSGSLDRVESGTFRETQKSEVLVDARDSLKAKYGN